MARRETRESEEITARPTRGSDQVGTDAPAESGLSMAPEDLGRSFLSFAVEQGSSQWPEGFSQEDTAEEDAWALLDASELEAEARLGSRAYERVIRRTLNKGKGLFAPPKLPREFEGPSHAWDEVNLCDEAIQEASLLDHEGAELGEAEPPSVLETDDTHTHGKRRGGHWPASRARRASPRAQSGKTLR
jgi:hypothetical protein